MADEPDNLVLDLLRAVRTDMRDMKLDILEMKHRIGAVEETCASLSRGVDRIGDDVHLIKRRLDPVDA